ncbi:MAG TPA: hypothetical protein VFU36_16380 [Jatrophihabitans sp.]|nr:hypothetical protein [Jatrophihabitans sp.]
MTKHHYLMQLLTGLLGALIGGSLALLAGWLNDRRGQRNATYDRIRELAAAVERAVYMMEDCVLETQVQHDERFTTGVSVMRLDVGRLTSYEAELVSASVELRWLSQRTSIASKLDDVGNAVGALINHWGGESREWNAYDQHVRETRAALRDEVQRFVSMTPRSRRRYLAAKERPLANETC